MSFIGDTSCKLDVKWRMSVPSTFLSQIGKVEADARFVVKKSIFKKCLELYPSSEWEILIGRIRKKINPFNKKHNEFLTQFHRGTAELSLDGSNRLTLPKRLLDAAGIGNDVVLAGVGGMIEIWDKQTYESLAISDTEFETLAEDILGDDFKLDD